MFRPSAEREQEARDAALADPVIDRLVAATDRRLSCVKGYRETLRNPVIVARGRLGEAIARIPGPIEVGERTWSEDPTVRALFARGGDAAEAFSADAGTRAFFEAHPACDCFGMLALLQSERRVLASAMHGDSVQAEVARTTLSFSEPQVLAPCADEAAVRNELVMRALEYLALRALERVGSLRSQRRELEKEHALLRAELRLAERRGAGFGAIAPVAEEGARGDAGALERDLERTVRELEQSASRNLLSGLLEELLGVLAHPAEHIAIGPCALALDSMNFAVAPSPQAVTPRVAMLRLAHRGPFAVLIARFPRAELRAARNRLAEAEKFL